MKKVILTSKEGKTFVGTLQGAGSEVAVDPRLSAAIGAGNYPVGVIEAPPTKYQALFTIESAANEDEPEERRNHEQWMREQGTKPGDAIGMAIDKNGRIYRFKSA